MDSAFVDFDPYQVLGVPRDAAKDLIKTSYRKLAIACHPDKFTTPNVKKVKEEEFKALTLSYDILINEERRAQHDRMIRLQHMREKDHAQDGHGDNTPALDKARGGSTKKKSRPSGMLVTQGFIQGRQVNAMPDTGAGYNIIAASLAQSLGFVNPPANASVRGFEIRLAHGKYIRTIGVIEAIWSFSSDIGKTWELTFHVIEDFVYDAVLGNDFLMATETMSKHQCRLSRIPPPIRALSVLYVNTLGCVTQRLRGLLNDSVVDTLPDSGCESNLLSLQYIQERAWIGEMDSQDMRLLLFADGTIQRTMGTLKLRWSFLTSQLVGGIVRERPEQRDVMVEFHVLYGCVYDVILGQDMLEETGAFSEHQDAFLETSQGDSAYSRQSELNLVIWLPFKRPKKRDRPDSDSETTLASDVSVVSLSRELQRRAAADHAILRMKEGSARDNVIAEEKEIRDRFESKRLRKGPLGSSNSPGASARSVSSMTISTTSGPAQSPSLRNPAPRGYSRLVNLVGMNLRPCKDSLGLSLGASIRPGK